MPAHAAHLRPDGTTVPPVTPDPPPPPGYQAPEVGELLPDEGEASADEPKGQEPPD
jgi:hypothetical protein